MLQTRTLPNWPNHAKEEFQVNFEKLDKWFAVLQNVQATLKITDGNNSQLDSIVLKKRAWITKESTVDLPNISSQLYYKDKKWWERHILTDWKSFKLKDWTDVNSPITLTWGSAINSVVVNSYTWNAIHKWKHIWSIKWTWDNVEYDYNTDLTKLTYNDWEWEDNQLLNRVVILNTNYESIVYPIEENWEDWVKVRWDMIWITTTTSADITTDSDEIEVWSTEWFPTWWGSVKIWTWNDEFYYTVIDWNKFSWVTWLSINYASWTQIKSWLTRVATSDPFEIKHPAITNKIVDTSKNYKAGWGWELVGKTLIIKSWTWQWQTRKIISNDKDTITVDIAFNPLPDSSSTYEIYDETWQVMYIVNWDNKMWKFNGEDMTEIGCPSWKYIEMFDWRMFVANTTYVIPDEISLKITQFTASTSDYVYVDNVDDLPDAWTCEVAKKDWTTYQFTYWSLNADDKELWDINWLSTNLEKNDIIKFVSRRREWTATDWNSNSITDTNKKWKDDVFKDMYLVIVWWKNAWTKTKISSNTENKITLSESLPEDNDDTTEYQIHTVDKFSVYYSDVNDYEDFNILLRFITLPWNDEITWLKVWNDKLFVFKKNSIWSVSFVFNSTLQQFVPRTDKIPTDTWCAYWRSIVQVEDALWFFDWKEYKSVWFSDTQIWVIKTDSVSFQINKLFKNITATNEDEISALYSNKKFYFAPKSNDNMVYVFDYEYNTWITYTGWNVWSLLEDDDFNIYIWSSNNWDLYKIDESIYNDNGVPINTVIETKAIDLGNDHLYKRFRHAAFNFEWTKAEMTVSAMINTASSQKVISSGSYIISPTTSWFWTIWFWEVWFWESSESNTTWLSLIKKAINKRWVTMKLRVDNNNNENFNLWWMSFTYSVMKEKHFPNRLIR